jgi:uncharacterized repeat protein (TIGR01451 family)
MQRSIEQRAESLTFAQLVRDLADSGISFRFQALGRSMLPVIEDGDVLHVEPVGRGKLKSGDIIFFRKDGEFRAHRILRKKGECFVTRGDAGMNIDGEVARAQIVGRVVAKECQQNGCLVTLAGAGARMRFFLAEARRRVPVRAFFMLALSWLLFSAALRAQVVVSGTPTTGTAQVTGTGAVTFVTISNYVVPVGTNRLMIVGVSISTQGNNVGSSVSTITYGTQSLTKIAATVLETASRRVEMWQLLAPSAGTANITINGNKTGANNNKLGVVAGVITFTGVNQTSPLRSSTAASGSSATASASVSSSGADFVLDTLCVAGTITVTSPTGQTSRWNTMSAATGQDATGVASSNTGTSPTATMSENLSGSSAWTIAVISIRAFGADLSITKVGNPDPVLQNASVTYTLTITNNGLQNAPGVLVSDVLPTQVSFVSVTQSQGSCAQAAGTVSCVLGAMVSGATATVTIVTTAITPSLAVNTAVVSPAAVVDPDLTNNTATFTSTITFPNSVRLNSFTAVPGAKGTLLSWNSGGELHNLGFNVYRDVNGEKVKLNSSLIAGSALLMRDTVEQHAAKTYRWIDTSQSVGGVYWLEDVDLNGTRTLHGPVALDAATSASPAVTSRSAMIQDLTTSAKLAPRTDVAITQNASPVARVRESVMHLERRSESGEVGFKLAAAPAVKIYVDHEGWYRVTQPQLAAAGFIAGTNAKFLHLYAEGVEQPIRITGGERFGSQSAIEFYGTAIDTPYSGQRVYWLTEGRGPGLRVRDAAGSGSAAPQAQSFVQTLELKPRTTYFGTLLRDNIDDFFGPLVSSVADSETVNVANLASGEAMMAVALQGVTDGQQHTVTIMLNGATLGELSFANQNQGREEFPIPSGVLTNGSNTITLLAQGGDNDFSLVNTIDISFPHTFTAEADLLKFTADAGESVGIGGFVQPPSRLIDITNPTQPRELKHEAVAENGLYTLNASVPWTTPGQHTLIALSDAQLASPVALAAHHPSNLHSVQTGADYVVLTAPPFAAQAQPLASLHQSEGKTVALVSVDDVYDEFNFGERTPFAIRSFLKTATEAWKNKPKYLLLVGDASVDPRDYLGFGSFDFVPTKIVPTAELMTASDDWFSDFENTGSPKIAIGRLPARTQDDAQMMVAKIIGYAKGTPSTWNSRALMVADTDDPTMSFSQQSLAVQNLLPQNITATDVFAGTLGTATARQNLLDGINNGQLLVNYNGHGSVEVWSGGGLFNDTQAATLTNGNKLPLFVIMNCLNGFFHDVYTQSMAEALMLAPNGGAVAVWASSGLTAPDPQFAMDRKLAQTLFSNSTVPLGDAVLAAKSSISDQDVRKTFIFFGDPAMRLQVPQSNSTAAPKPVSGAPAPIRDIRPGPPPRLRLGKPDPRTVE